MIHNCLDRVITCDESMTFFTYDPEKICQCSLEEPEFITAKKKRENEQIKIQHHDYSFFDKRGITYVHWVPEGQMLSINIIMSTF